MKKQTTKKWYKSLCESCKSAVNPKRKCKIKSFRPNWDKKDGYGFPSELSNEFYYAQYPISLRD